MSCYDRLPIPAPPLVSAAESSKTLKLAVQRQTSMSSSTTSATSCLSIDSSYNSSTGMDSSSESVVSTDNDNQRRRRRRSNSPGPSIPEEESAPTLLASSRRSGKDKSPSKSADSTVPSSTQASTATTKPRRRVPRRNRSFGVAASATTPPSAAALTAGNTARAPLRRNRTFHNAPAADTASSAAPITANGAPKKTVSFDLDRNTRHVYKHRRRPNQSNRSLWYPLKDLETLLEHEVRIHKRSTATTTSTTTTVRASRKHTNVYTCSRGLEGTLAGISTSDKCKAYVWKMLGAQSRLRKAVQLAAACDDNNFNPEQSLESQSEAVRLFSRQHTQTDRQTAYQLGLQDASDVTLFWQPTTTDMTAKPAGPQHRFSSTSSMLSRFSMVGPSKP